MSSIMRSRSALTGRCEGWEFIGGSSLELKVAGPSMLGIGCPDRHALPVLVTAYRSPTHHRRRKHPDADARALPRERVRSSALNRLPAGTTRGTIYPARHRAVQKSSYLRPLL